MDDTSILVLFLVLALGGIYAAYVLSPWKAFGKALGKSRASNRTKESVIFRVRWSPVLEALSGLRRVKHFNLLRKVLFFSVLVIIVFLGVRFGIVIRILRIIFMAERFAPVFFLSVIGVSVGIWYLYKRITRTDGRRLKGLEDREFFTFSISGVTETFPLIDVLRRQVDGTNRITQVLGKFENSRLRNRIDEYCVELLLLLVSTLESRTRANRRIYLEMFPKGIAALLLGFPEYVARIEALANDPESASSRDTNEKLQRLVEAQLEVVRQCAKEMKRDTAEQHNLWISYMGREIGLAI